MSLSRNFSNPNRLAVWPVSISIRFSIFECALLEFSCARALATVSRKLIALKNALNNNGFKYGAGWHKAVKIGAKKLTPRVASVFWPRSFRVEIFLTVFCFGARSQCLFWPVDAPEWANVSLFCQRCAVCGIEGEVLTVDKVFGEPLAVD